MIYQYKPLIVSMKTFEFLEFISANNLWMIRDETGYTPLHTAIDMGRTQLASLIIESNPETINAITYKGETPLHIACMCHDVECTDLLLDAGANPQALSVYSETPYQAAIAHQVREFLDAIRTKPESWP